MILFNRYVLADFVDAKLEIGGRQHLVGSNMVYPPRIEFDFSHTRDRGTNEGTVSIYNMSQESIKNTAKENAHVRITAGYWPHNGAAYIGVIFEGTITKVETTKTDGVTKVTQFTVKHGWTAFRDAKTTRKFAAGTTHLAIVTAICNDMIAAEPRLSLGTIDVPAATEVRPRTLETRSVRALDDYCAQHDLDWIIQDNKIHVTPSDDELSDGKMVFTPDTGMLGEPKTTDLGIEIQLAMIPTVRPGQLIRHANKYVGRDEQSFVIDEVRFSGNNYDGDFGVTITTKKTKEKPKKAGKSGRKRSAATATKRGRAT